MFQLAVRTWRRKKATKVMKKFLEENMNRNQMSVMVSRFLIKVKHVQRFIRNFLACHFQRIGMMGALWDEVESKFAKKLEIRMKEARKMRKLEMPATR